MEMAIAGHTYRMERDMLDVTSISRPDPGWRFVDALGHVHVWHDENGPATAYRPYGKYFVPTLVRVSDGMFWDSDWNDEYELWHFECAICGETIEPGETADTSRQFIPGKAHYYIDDEPVSADVFNEAVAQLQR